MPVKYNEDDKNPAVVKNDDVEEEEFQTYLKILLLLQSMEKNMQHLEKSSKTDHRRRKTGSFTGCI